MSTTMNSEEPQGEGNSNNSNNNSSSSGVTVLCDDCRKPPLQCIQAWDIIDPDIHADDCICRVNFVFREIDASTEDIIEMFAALNDDDLFKEAERTYQACAKLEIEVMVPTIQARLLYQIETFDHRKDDVPSEAIWGIITTEHNVWLRSNPKPIKNISKSGAKLSRRFRILQQMLIGRGLEDVAYSIDPADHGWLKDKELREMCHLPGLDDL